MLGGRGVAAMLVLEAALFPGSTEAERAWEDVEAEDACGGTNDAEEEDRIGSGFMKNDDGGALTAPPSLCARRSCALRLIRGVAEGGRVDATSMVVDRLCPGTPSKLT